VRSQHVYFIQASTGEVKIGISQAVDDRFESMRAMSPVPLRLVGIIRDGGRKREAELHTRFARHRLHHEWFSPAVLDDIEALPDLERPRRDDSLGEYAIRLIESYATNIVTGHPVFLTDSEKAHVRDACAREVCGPSESMHTRLSDEHRFIALRERLGTLPLPVDIDQLLRVR
jgi:hypothetical protein